MTNLRRKHTAQFKAKVALEAIKEERTSIQIASQYGVHSTQVRAWKKKALDALEVIFSNGIKNEAKKKDELIENLFNQIGQLKLEKDFLKKKMGLLSQNPF